MAQRITHAQVQHELDRFANEIATISGTRPEFTLYLGNGSYKVDNHVVDPVGNVFSNGDLGTTKADAYRAIRAATAALRYLGTHSRRTP